MMEKKLTPKQGRFVKELIKTKFTNATQAAIKAGYSKKTAKVIASETLTKPYIKAKIEAVMNEEAEKIGITAAYVLSNIKSIADRLSSEKDLATILKANEILAKILDLFPKEKLDVTLQEHRDNVRQLSELE